MNTGDLIEEANIGSEINDKNTARLIINKDKIIDTNEVKGLKVDAREIKDGVDIKIRLEENTLFRK